MKISNKKISILTALFGLCGIFAYAQNSDGAQSADANLQQAVAGKSEDFKSLKNNVPADTQSRIEFFRKRREARRLARAENRGDVASQSAVQIQEVQEPKEGVSQTTQMIGDNELLHNLASKNPFMPIAGKSSMQSPEGISLKSIAMVDGKWVFSVSDKSGKTMWVGVGEEIENAPCKIDSFDEKTMTVKASVEGKQIDLALMERSVTASSTKVELVDAIKPRRMIAPHERAKVWSQYATNEQREAANRVWQTARAQGRNYLNREDRRKIFEIERQIKIPENANQGVGQPPMPPMPPASQMPPR